MDNKSLIKIAESALNKYTDPNGRLHGDVGAAVLGKNGKVYTGVCVDTPSWGLCAERSALAGMITDREYNFQKIVAVWRDEKTSKLHVLPPCGHCRQFMRDISELNMEAEVILGLDKSEPLKNLIPLHEWPKPIE
jgi:cytidine deaminase